MTDTRQLKAPFPYFGGKRQVADLVWQRFGDVANYIEPFCGSAAVLLLRPTAPRVETINDADCYVANFWRSTGGPDDAVPGDPEAVARYADGPVNEADLHSRHKWLVLSEDAQAFRDRIRTDPHYFDPKIAGWWCWGLCCWIGSGWCAEGVDWQAMPPLKDSGGLGVTGKMPRMTGGRHGDQRYGGLGVHADKTSGGQARHLSATDRGVNKTAGRPQLADAFDIGRGVHAQGHLGTCQERRDWLVGWFLALRDRLRLVRVCCGHWSRICSSKTTTTRLGTTGVFLDPPYPTHKSDGTESRAGSLYSGDDKDETNKIRDEVLAYCQEHGPDPNMRIAVCGYDTDGYARLVSSGWAEVKWKAVGGYGNRGGDNVNRGRERIWFSPACQNKPKGFGLI